MYNLSRMFGIASNDVRLVVHYGCWCSLVQYTQETGRAAREPGTTANCIGLVAKQYKDEMIRAEECNLSIGNESGGGSGKEQAGGRARGPNNTVSFVDAQQDVCLLDKSEEVVVHNAWMHGIYSWVENNTECRKKSLYRVTNGYGSDLGIYDERCVNCDVCEKMFPTPTTESVVSVVQTYHWR